MSQQKDISVFEQLFYKDIEKLFEDRKKYGTDKESLISVIRHLISLEIFLKIIRVANLIFIGCCVYFIILNLFTIYILAYNGYMQFLLYSCFAFLWVVCLNFFREAFKNFWILIEMTIKKRDLYIGMLKESFKKDGKILS